MLTDPLTPADLTEAATIAFAMVRFAEGAAHPARGQSPPGMKLGEDVYSFVPSPTHIPISGVPQFLAGLPCPAFLLPTTTRGIVSLHLLDDLPPERAQHMQHEFENQAAGLDERAAQMKLGGESRVILEFGDEVLITTLAALRIWSRRFAVFVGWNIAPLHDDPRASARIDLFRSDGENSLGAPGPPSRDRLASG